MIEHDVVQQSKEWFALRETRMTASHASAIQANGPGLKSYIDRLMYEYYSNAEPDRFSNKHTDRGNELEDSAVYRYKIGLELETRKIGFVEYDDYSGCSPDLFVGKSGGCEIKCPDDKEFFRLLRGGEIQPGYIWQIQMTMMICNRDWWDFFAYNPNFEKDFVKERFYINKEKTDRIKAGLASGEKMIKKIQSQMEKILKPTEKEDAIINVICDREASIIEEVDEFKPVEF